MSKTRRKVRNAAEAESEADREIARWVRSTYGPQAIVAGGAAVAVHLDSPSEIFRRGYKNPAVVASQACSGARLELALRTGSAADLGAAADVGADAVSRCVNDIAALGAEPLLVVPHLELPRGASGAAPAVFRGMAAACREAGCAIVAGARSEGISPCARGSAGLVALGVGVAERSKLLVPEGFEPGDDVVAVFARGLHPGGLRRIQRVVRLRGAELLSKPQGFERALGRALLEPREVLVPAIRAVLRGYRRKRVIRAIAQVGEGGPVGALERLLGGRLGAVL